MPRNYVRKPKTYSDLQIEEALTKVRNNELSYRDAESIYNIDKSLLWRRIHNYNTSKQGRKTVLTKEEEEDLAEKIKIMAKWGWALTRKEIREIVHTYIVQNNVKNNFKDNYPGKDWLQLFFKRNGLVAKKMEQLEKSRRQATSDPFIIYNFYKILDEALTDLSLHDKPHHIYNLDETSFSSDPTRIKGVTGKGQKAHRIIQGSGKDNTTVLGCVSADGRLLPPLIIFKGQNLWSSWKGTQDIPGTTYACSENGWMMSSIFNEWFENFCKKVTERPLLVIFDGHVTHLDPATIGLAKRENVTLLKLPPHTTDLLQPMDRSCFSPIKYRWNERLIEWQRLNQRTLTKSEFCNLLSEVWRGGLSKEVIQNSFRVTGLYPVNKEAYPKDRLDPVKLDRYNKTLLSSNSIPDPMDIFENSQVEHIECVSPSVLDMETSGISIHQNTERGPIPITISPETQNNAQPESMPRAAACTAFCQNRDIISSDHHIRPEPSCSFESLLLNKIKHTQPITGKRRKIDGKGKLLTTEEYLRSIENLQLERKQKNSKKGEPKKRKQKKKAKKARYSDTDTDTDIQEKQIPYEDESDVENINSLSVIIEDQQDEELDELHNETTLSKTYETERQHTENMLLQAKNLTSESSTTDKVIQIDELEYGIGDFILLSHTINKNKNYYVARIEGSDDDENFSVIYLKRVKTMCFAYPDARIIYSVHKDEIVMKLPAPKQKNKRSALMFDIDLKKYNVK